MVFFSSLSLYTLPGNVNWFFFLSFLTFFFYYLSFCLCHPIPFHIKVAITTRCAHRLFSFSFISNCVWLTLSLYPNAIKVSNWAKPSQKCSIRCPIVVSKTEQFLLDCYYEPEKKKKLFESDCDQLNSLKCILSSKITICLFLKRVEALVANRILQGISLFKK